MAVDFAFPWEEMQMSFSFRCAVHDWRICLQIQFMPEAWMLMSMHCQRIWTSMLSEKDCKLHGSSAEELQPHGTRPIGE